MGCNQQGRPGTDQCGDDLLNPLKMTETNTMIPQTGMRKVLASSAKWLPDPIVCRAIRSVWKGWIIPLKVVGYTYALAPTTCWIGMVILSAKERYLKVLAGNKVK